MGSPLFNCVLVIFAASLVQASELSPAGKKRLEENLKVLEQNVKDTEKNIFATRKNVETIDAEMANLEKLDNEHRALKQRYATYIENAKSELEKNNKALAELKKYEAKMNELATRGNLTAAQTADLEKARRERMDRERWKTESSKKIDKIAELDKKLDHNIASIHSRKGPLRAQRQSWIDKQKRYEFLLSEIQQRQTEANQKLGGHAVASPEKK